MKVFQINWLSEAAQEAEVEISDGPYSCVAFSQPCKVNVKDQILEPLHAFSSRDLRVSEESEVGIWPIQDSSLRRRIVGVLSDSENQIISVGGIRIVVEEPFPGGVEKGDLVEFECARIDLW